jgi:hypothetical protein
MMVDWWPKWMRARSETHGGNGAAELTLDWDDVIERFHPDGAGVLYTLIIIAHGRHVFDACVSDVLALLAMSQDRFDELVEQLEIAGLISTQPAAYGSTRWKLNVERAVPDSDAFYRGKS